MDTREIRKNVTKIMQQIDSFEENISFGTIDPTLSKLHKDLKKFQSKCPHNDGTYELGAGEYCEICNKRM